MATPRSSDPAPVSAQTTAHSPVFPVLSVVAGIGVFSMMDAAMKAATLAMGVAMALLLRNIFATMMTLPIWLVAGRPLPSRHVFAIHVQRAVITACMGMCFFYGLARIPMAESIALTFIAPIVALYLASIMLGEKIRRRAIWAALLGLVGVAVIGMGRFGGGTYSDEALGGTLAILTSALLYAGNLVLQRKQALLAGPVEIALFQNLLVTLIFLAFSPLYAFMPGTGDFGIALAGGALATMALLFLSWGYARAEAQVLLPIEYTGFLWAALLGWVFFDEIADGWTLAGAALIVLGCWIGTQKGAPNPQV